MGMEAYLKMVNLDHLLKNQDSVAFSVYKKAKQVPEEEREAFLMKELEEIKDCKKRKDRARELESIDMNNIISSSTEKKENKEEEETDEKDCEEVEMMRRRKMAMMMKKKMKVTNSTKFSKATNQLHRVSSQGCHCIQVLRTKRISNSAKRTKAKTELTARVNNDEDDEDENDESSLLLRMPSNPIIPLLSAISIQSVSGFNWKK
ncbi:hypothetical protein STAS_20030 [Striga asiatica]|uniref:Uncharacterized protein n=1 Tax=Striga asiatica TaxID=4170 RepID=A0A5A7QDW8_STRAF|nr:hypothetical protein STAS_20030 [Striga asiatica]